MRRVSRASALASPRRRLLAALSAAAVVVGVAAAVPPSVSAAPASTTKITVAKEKKGLAKGHDYTSGRYIVTLKGAPAASYMGGIAGYPRTRPTAGKKLNPTRAEVIKYRDRLKGIQAKVAASLAHRKVKRPMVGGADVYFIPKLTRQRDPRNHRLGPGDGHCPAG